MLVVDNLSLSVAHNGAYYPALKEVSFSLLEAGSLGIVGESGSGKTLTALAIAGLSAAAIKRESGSIRFQDIELTDLNEAKLQALRGKEISFIFQDSGNSLNPLMTVGDQVIEGLLLFDHLPLKEAKEIAEQLFTEVELPASVYPRYPHELSGGQRQRVMIALALAREPRLLIADEPTTALDLTTQRQLLLLLQRLHRERQMSLLLISHDIAVVRQLTDQLLVLYAGQIMEIGATKAILTQPRHPYTKGLLGAMPSFTKRDKPLATLKGVAEPLTERPLQGCVFAKRCPQASNACTRDQSLKSFSDGTRVRCCQVS